MEVVQKLPPQVEVQALVGNQLRAEYFMDQNGAQEVQRQPANESSEFAHEIRVVHLLLPQPFAKLERLEDPPLLVAQVPQQLRVGQRAVLLRAAADQPQNEGLLLATRPVVKEQVRDVLHRVSFPNLNVDLLLRLGRIGVCNNEARKFQINYPIKLKEKASKTVGLLSLLDLK